MNRNIMIAMGFGEHVHAVDEGLCPFCKKPIIKEDFRDALSLREFEISGICQSCQDDFFGKKD